MNMPGSEVSWDSSDSSADSPHAKLAAARTVEPDPASESRTTFHAHDMTVEQDNDDSDSDVSMSAETDDEYEEGPKASTIQLNFFGRGLGQPIPLAAGGTPVETSNKRKYQDSIQDLTTDHIINADLDGAWERLKPMDEGQGPETASRIPCQDKSRLPAEIWHHIFTFLPPRRLGLLLQINKCFNAYLDPSSKYSPAHLSSSPAKYLNADSIWKASRVLFRPGMPAPLIGKSELDMWRLACSFSCQFCGKKQLAYHPPMDQWHPGPGENGNVPVWLFGIRTCGTCLCERSSKVGR